MEWMYFQSTAISVNLQHLQSDLLDGVGRLQTLGANLLASHDRATSEQAVGIVSIGEPLLRRVITAIDDERTRLRQSGRSYELSGFHQVDGHWPVLQPHKMHSWAPFTLSRSAGDLEVFLFRGSSGLRRYVFALTVAAQTGLRVPRIFNLP
jgi:hypothetical protein